MKNIYVVFDKEWNLQAMSNLSISEKSVSNKTKMAEQILMSNIPFGWWRGCACASATVLVLLCLVQNYVAFDVDDQMFASDFAWLPKPFTGFERFFSMLGF